MYSGHFAAGLALSAKERRVPSWIILVGIGFLDLIDGALVVAGIERMTPAPALPLSFSLDFIDWDHSVVMALLWATVFALFFWKERRVAIVAWIAVMSHLALDWVVHNGDLALWPHSTIRLGFGLWGRLPVGSWWLEGALDLVLGLYFARVLLKEGVPAARVAWPLLLLAGLHVSYAPALSPLRWVALHVAMPRAQTLAGLLVLLGFAVPAPIFARLLRAPPGAAPAPAPARP